MLHGQLNIIRYRTAKEDHNIFALNSHMISYTHVGPRPVSTNYPGYTVIFIPCHKPSYKTHAITKSNTDIYLTV